MLLAILAFWWGYKKAKATGRNAAMWSIICGVTFIGIQLAVAFGVGIFIGLGAQLWGWDTKMVDNYSLLITIASFVPAFVTLLIMLKFLDRPVRQPVMTQPPPPPPTFGQ